MNITKLKEAIDQLPAGNLPELLVHIIRLCVEKKVFKEKKISEVVGTIEAKF